jgi:transposase InsO family protein
MKRRASKAVIERNSPVVAMITEIKTDHPFWGYRRVWAHLKYVNGLEINRKRVFRLMQRHKLVVKPNTRLKAVRTPQRSKPRPVQPRQWWGIDMTKVMVVGFGWMYIVAVLDWYTKKIVGHYAGVQCRSCHWLEALNDAVNREFPGGVRDNGLSLMSDNGSQPTSVAFMRACREMGVNHAFTSYGNPKGNADTERVFRTMKEELLWLREWRSPFELTEALAKWIEDYNRSYLHSSLGYKSPEKFEEKYYSTQPTLLLTP